MKTIRIKIDIVDDAKAGVDQMVLEKTAAANEVEVLASGISTIFLKSKDALAIANKKGRRLVRIGRKSKK